MRREYLALRMGIHHYKAQNDRKLCNLIVLRLPRGHLDEHITLKCPFSHLDDFKLVIVLYTQFLFKFFFIIMIIYF